MNRSHLPVSPRGKSISRGFIFGFLISAILWAAALGIIRALI
ncbi:hypothetical protein [Novosphingobium sp.]|nr:hypothetical protein [Novosphingobium sp.]